MPEASEAAYESVRVDVDEGARVASVLLDRPEKRNALNAMLVDELTDALAWADADDRVNAVLLSGSGDDFCAGGDLEKLQELVEAEVEEQLADADALGDLFLIMRRIETPIVAAVTGHAVAGGCGLATACDIVLASEDARFGYPEIGLGFVPAMVMAMLRRSVGERRAFELIATGRIIDAGEAERYGLVNRVFPASEFGDRSRRFTEELARHSSSALALSKRLLYGTEGHSFEAAIREGAEINVLARLTEDCRQGVARFLESRRDKRR